MTIASIEKVFIQDLKDLYGLEEAGSISWLVIGSVCRINRLQYLAGKDEELNETQLSTFYRILSTLKSGVPVQYALGETEFYGSVFKVNPSVLIPRPETEELVDWVLKDIKLYNKEPDILKILDIGTGSGCIPITLGKYIPKAEISALDVSFEALAQAKENAALNNIGVNFIQDDILNPVSRASKYAIITSNPPYVTIGEKEQMHANVLEHEPHSALFVPDDDPLIFYRAIADFALSTLEDKGCLYLEINENFGAETVELLKKKGFKHVELRKDLRDRDRMIKAQIS